MTLLAASACLFVYGCSMELVMCLNPKPMKNFVSFLSDEGLSCSFLRLLNMV